MYHTPSPPESGKTQNRPMPDALSISLGTTLSLNAQMLSFIAYFKFDYCAYILFVPMLV